jgi:K+-transporting ATPase A subunit
LDLWKERANRIAPRLIEIAPRHKRNNASAHEAQANSTEGSLMLWTIIVVLLILWLLGLVGSVGGSLIHILLVIALVVLIINLLQGRRGI